MLPDVRGQSEDFLQSLTNGVLRGMCDAFSIPYPPNASKVVLVRKLVAAGVLEKTHPREALLASYDQRHQAAWRLLAIGQSVVHEAIQYNTKIPCEPHSLLMHLFTSKKS